MEGRLDKRHPHTHDNKQPLIDLASIELIVLHARPRTLVSPHTCRERCAPSR